jgi:cytochrome b561
MIMPDPGKQTNRPNGSGAKVVHMAPRAYAPVARMFHWITVGIVFVMFPVGLYMTYRGNTLNIWDGTTNTLYAGHKLFGFILLWLIVGRLVYRLQNGAPPDEPTLEPWQRGLSHITHWSMYGLLILVPLMGWIGISLYGARDIFGLFSLPALWTKNPDAATTAFWLHEWLGRLLALLIVTHVGAALFHHFVRKDGVLRRMLPKKT